MPFRRREEPWASDAPDVELIEATRDGDTEAFAVLYGRTVDVVAGVTARDLPTDAVDDVVAEAYTLVFAALQDGKGPKTSFQSYVVTVARHLAARTMRSVRRTDLVEDMGNYLGELGVDLDRSAEASAFDNVERRLIRGAYASLSATARVILWLVEVLGMTQVQAATHLGVSRSMIDAQLRRARRNLRIAYVAAHVPGLEDEGWHPSSELLAKHAHGIGRSSDLRKVDAHLPGCPRCRVRGREAEGVQVLRGVLVPAMLAPVVGRLDVPQRARFVAPVVGARTWFSGLGPSGVAGLVLAGAGLGALIVAGIVAVVSGALTPGDEPPGAHSNTAADRGAGSRSLPVSSTAAVPTTVPAAPQAMWSSEASVTGAQPGEERSLEFEVESGGRDLRFYTIEFTLGQGLEPARTYRECAWSDGVLRCPARAIGIDAATYQGVLEVRVVDPSEAALPGLAIESL